MYRVLIRCHKSNYQSILYAQLLGQFYGYPFFFLVLTLECPDHIDNAHIYLPKMVFHNKKNDIFT